MAYQGTSIATGSFAAPGNIFQRLGRFFSTIGQKMIANSAGQRRLDRICALEAMTDAELAKLNITRDEIPHYVFRDLYYV